MAQLDGSSIVLEPDVGGLPDSHRARGLRKSSLVVDLHSSQEKKVLSLTKTYATPVPTFAGYVLSFLPSLYAVVAVAALSGGMYTGMWSIYTCVLMAALLVIALHMSYASTVIKTKDTDHRVGRALLQAHLLIQKTKDTRLRSGFRALSFGRTSRFSARAAWPIASLVTRMMAMPRIKARAGTSLAFNHWVAFLQAQLPHSSQAVLFDRMQKKAQHSVILRTLRRLFRERRRRMMREGFGKWRVSEMLFVAALSLDALHDWTKHRSGKKPEDILEMKRSRAAMDDLQAMESTGAGGGFAGGAGAATAAQAKPVVDAAVLDDLQAGIVEMLQLMSPATSMGDFSPAPNVTRELLRSQAAASRGTPAQNHAGDGKDVLLTPVRGGGGPSSAFSNDAGGRERGHHHAANASSAESASSPGGLSSGLSNHAESAMRGGGELASPVK